MDSAQITLLVTPNATVSAHDVERAEIDRLRTTCGSYDANIDHWHFLLKSYEGGPSYVSAETLFSHQREVAEDYADRMKRAHYTNLVAPIVTFVSEFIFKETIERQPDADLQDDYHAFEKNVDGSGKNLDEFMETVANELRLFGNLYVAFDKQAPPSDIDVTKLSKFESEQHGLNRAYPFLVRPMEVLDWVYDRFGGLVYIKRCEKFDRFEGIGHVTPIERYYEWTASTVRITDIDVSDPTKPKLSPSAEASGQDEVNKFSCVPFIPAFTEKSISDSSIGLSAVRDIAYGNRHVFNLTSLLDEFLFRQAFNILAMENDSSLPTKDRNEGTFGTSNVLGFSRNAAHKPFYLSPPVDPAEFMQSERNVAINEMFRQASQDVASEIYAVSNRSGDAAKQAFGRTAPTITRLADTLQALETRMAQMWARLTRKAEWTGKIGYRKDYSISSLLDLLVQLNMILQNVRVQSPTFIREQMKRVVREVDGRLTQDMKKKIYAEIDAIEDDDLIELYAKGGDIQSQEGVASAGQLIQGEMQDSLDSDAKIGAATGSKAATKEALADKNKRATARAEARKTRLYDDGED